MAATALLSALALAVVVVWMRWPAPDELRPRLATELAVILGFGLAGSFFSDEVGTLVAAGAVVPFLALGATVRRCQRLLAVGDGPRLLRACDVLDVLSWPCPTQATNLGLRHAGHVLAADLAGYRRFIDAPGRRPSRALQLERDGERRDWTAVEQLSREVLASHQPPDLQVLAAANLSRFDLPEVLAWYRSDASRRARRAPSLDALILQMAGRPTGASAIASALGGSQLMIAAARGRAHLAAGTDPAVALAELRGLGDAGAAHADAIVESPVFRGDLDEQDQHTIAEIEQRALHSRHAMGPDNGTWRPAMTLLLVAVLSASFARQLLAGSITADRLYEMGAYITGPSREHARALTAPYLHGSLGHFAWNVLSLMVLGRIVEARFSRLSFVAIWVAASILPFIAMGIAMDEAVLIAGASGGVMGLLGAGLAVLLYSVDDSQPTISTTP